MGSPTSPTSSPDAVANLEAQGLDVTGEGWQRVEVGLNEGGR
jgi:hypothetical protein